MEAMMLRAEAELNHWTVGKDTVIGGACEGHFQRVLEAFIANFAHRGEIGAAVCVYERGRKVVDLWGGMADPAARRAWECDTIVCMMSVGKAMAALCALRLVDRGQLDLDAPVAAYWPEFAQAGKDRITVAQLLGGHAGLIYLDHAPEGALLDWGLMIEALEQQAPAWRPGTRGAYHSMTYGHLVGELIKRVDGRHINVFFDEEIARPLGADYRFGLSTADLRRVAPVIRNPESATMNAIEQRSGNIGRAWHIVPRVPDFFNSEVFRRAVLPSANGHGNARAVARIYVALAERGSVEGVHLLSSELIDRARQAQWDGECGLTLRDYRYGLGFFLNKRPLTPFGPNPGAFGHPGVGGAVGFADPENRIAFSYSPNYSCAGEGVGERCEALISAVYG